MILKLILIFGQSRFANEEKETIIEKLYVSARYGSIKKWPRSFPSHNKKRIYILLQTVKKKTISKKKMTTIKYMLHIQLHEIQITSSFVYGYGLCIYNFSYTV